MRKCFLILFLFLASCVHYTQADFERIFRQQAKPGCTMPTIEVRDYVEEVGYYIPSTHTIVLDKWASEKVVRHEMDHACGDMMGEGLKVR